MIQKKAPGGPGAGTRDSERDVSGDVHDMNTSGARPETHTTTHPKKILCTGAAGFLGSILVPDLLNAGHRVVAFDAYPHGCALLREASNTSNLDVHTGDIRNMAPTLFEDIDVVIHLAGLSNDASCEFDDGWARAINLDATIRLGEHARDAGVSHMVFASSCSVYGAGLVGILDESAPIAPISLYAEMKYDAEVALHELMTDDFGVLSFRMGTLFGAAPQMRFDLVANIMTLCAYRDQLVRIGGGGKQWRPMLHVRDAAALFQAGIHQRAAALRGDVFNAVGANCTIGELGQLVANITGAEVEILDQVADPRSYRVTGDALEETLGLKPGISLEEGIKDLLQQLKNGAFANPADERFYPTKVAKRIHEQMQTSEV